MRPRLRSDPGVSGPCGMKPGARVGGTSVKNLIISGFGRFWWDRLRTRFDNKEILSSIFPEWLNLPGYEEFLSS